MSDNEEISEKELLSQKHRKEKKELQAKIQGLKKTASKGDKKKKKEVTEQIANMEKELDAKQAQELQQMEQSLKDLSITEAPVEVTEKSEVPKEMRISKAQKRRDKKSQKEKERLAEIEKQQEENLTGVRQVEIDKIKDILKSRTLVIHDIPSDGDCLFAGLCHQLKIIQNETFSVDKLREEAASVIRDQADDFLPFLFDPKTGDMLTPSQFDKYVEDLKSTKVWGGQVELRALSQHLKSPIEVIQADGPSMIVGEEFKVSKPALILTYHRHMYGLGEHYNSTLPVNAS